MKRGGKVFRETLRKSRAGAAVFGLCAAVCAFVFFLYDLPGEPFFYAFLLAAVLCLAVFGASFARELSRAGQRERMVRAVLTEEALPPAASLAEEDYAEAVTRLREELTRLRNDYENARMDEVDYYTAWVHQIKTPIAVMRMELGDGGTENARALDAELFRIEQYADMVLQYIRLGSGSSDLVVREYPLDELIRESVRKFAPQFVAKKLRLCYDGTDASVVTDKKWFSCILEQLLSNAIKYTPEGGITIALRDGFLSVTDTGIGIAPEDVPRIFEKGFTGENGRLEKRSSGLGLYLCRKAADLLCIPLSVRSTVGEGSTFTLDLREKLRG